MLSNEVFISLSMNGLCHDHLPLTLKLVHLTLDFLAYASLFSQCKQPSVTTQINSNPTRDMTEAKIAISMTQTGDPYENALAERVNRTNKEEMLQNRRFVNFETAQEAVSRAIAHYNTLRPLGSCNYYTPDQAHQMEGELAKRWRQAKRRNNEEVQPEDSIFVTQKRP